MSLRNWLSHPPIGVGLIIAALVVGSGVYNHVWREDSDGTQNNAQTQDRAAAPSLPIIDAAPSPALQDTAQDQQGEYDGKKGGDDSSHWAILGEIFSNWSNVAIAGFTLVLTGVSIWQGIVIHKTLSQMKRSNNVAAEANRISRESLAIAKDATATQLRPHVHIASAYVKNVNKPDERRVIEKIQNYGQTPAHQLRFRVCVHVHEWPPEREFEGFPDDLRQAVAPIAPGNYREMSVPVGPLSDWEEAELQADRAAIYCWGDVRYLANGFLFAGRRTNFVLVCHGEGLKGGRLHPWIEGNDAN